MRPISYARIKKSIPGSMGIIARVQKKSGYKDWKTVADFIKSHPDLLQMMESEESVVDDIAEDTLVKKMVDGDEQTARWWLARRRRQKYGDSVDITTKGESIQIVKVGIDIDKL